MVDPFFVSPGQLWGGFHLTPQKVEIYQRSVSDTSVMPSMDSLQYLGGSGTGKLLREHSEVSLVVVVGVGREAIWGVGFFT